MCLASCGAVALGNAVASREPRLRLRLRLLALLGSRDCGCCQDAPVHTVPVVALRCSRDCGSWRSSGASRAIGSARRIMHRSCYCDCGPWPSLDAPPSVQEVIVVVW